MKIFHTNLKLHILEYHGGTTMKQRRSQGTILFTLGILCCGEIHSPTGAQILHLDSEETDLCPSTVSRDSAETDTSPPIFFRMHDTQTLPIDCHPSSRVRSGNLAMEPPTRPRVPEVLAFAENDGIRIIDNSSTEGSFRFLQRESAIPWTAQGESGNGYVKDVHFLDLLDKEGNFSKVGDGIDDHLFVAVYQHELGREKNRRDRLYRISVNSHDFQEVENAFDDTHNASAVITSRNLDAKNNLYIIVAGGVYDFKKHMTPETLHKDTLRILRFNPENPEKLFLEIDVPSIPSACMTDVDVFDANGDHLDDIVISVFQSNDGGHHSSMVLHNITEGSTLRFKKTDIARQDDSPLGDALGAGVGDVDGDGRTDIFFGSPNGFSIYLNQTRTMEKEQEIEFREWPEITIHWDTVDGFEGRQVPRITSSYVAEIATLEKDTDPAIDYVMVSGGIPYILVNETTTDRTGAPFVVFRDFLKDLPDEMKQKKHIGGPFYSDYSSTHLLVSDLDRDGHEDIVFANEEEQNTLWKCVFNRKKEKLSYVTDATLEYLPADGDDSTRLLVGDIDGDHDQDVIAINMLYPPDIYLNEKGKLVDGHYVANSDGRLLPRIDWFPHPFLDDNEKSKPTQNPEDSYPETAGGWDGILEDITGDGMPDLVIAGGGRNGEQKENIVYHLEQGRFIYKHRAIAPLFETLFGIRFLSGNYTLNTRGIATSDLNQDGFKDLIFANMDDVKLQVALNHGIANGNDKAGYFQQYANIAASRRFFDSGYSCVLVWEKHMLGKKIATYILAGGINGIDVYLNVTEANSFKVELPHIQSLRLSLLDDVKKLLPIDFNGDGARDEILALTEYCGHPEFGNGYDFIIAYNSFTEQFEILEHSYTNLTTSSYGAAIGQLNDDAYDDVILANAPHHTHDWSNHAFVNSNEKLLESTEAILDKSTNRDPTFDALLLDLDCNGEIESLLYANDGQNRLLTSSH